MRIVTQNLDNLKKNSDSIKQWAKDLGFSFVGISKSVFLEKEAPRLSQWLKEERHAGMSYMANHFDKRLDPRKLVPDSKSVVSLMYNYYPEQQQKSDIPQIAKYAYGDDYHTVVKEKLKHLLNKINDEIGEVHGRAFVDSAPVMERAWAQKSGLGWIGKHTLLINKQQGSFFFLAELIIDLPLAYDNPFQTDHCGTCTKCIDACPTDAITQANLLDANKCISYLTIELKDEVIPKEHKGQFENWMFGCDICQDVCPWNRFSKPHQEPTFNLKEETINRNSKEWEEITAEVFNKLFKHSPLKRSKFKGIKRNLEFLK